MSRSGNSAAAAFRLADERLISSSGHLTARAKFSLGFDGVVPKTDELFLCLKQAFSNRISRILAVTRSSRKCCRRGNCHMI